MNAVKNVKAEFLDQRETKPLFLLGERHLSTNISMMFQQVTHQNFIFNLVMEWWLQDICAALQMKKHGDFKCVKIQNWWEKWCVRSYLKWTAQSLQNLITCAYQDTQEIFSRKKDRQEGKGIKKAARCKVAKKAEKYKKEFNYLCASRAEKPTVLHLSGCKKWQINV